MTSDVRKRTNSLAFARSDCHTCASLSDKCDRRRPKCSACLDRGRCCGGFATPLSWDPKRMVNPSSSTTVSIASAAFSSPSKEYRFVKGATSPKRRRKEPKTRSAEQEDSSTVTTEVLLRATGHDMEVSEDHQSGNFLADFEEQEAFLPEDFALFNSLFPNIVATPPLDIEAQDILTADIPRMVPLATADCYAQLTPKELQNMVPMPQGPTPGDSNPQTTDGSALSSLSHLLTDSRISKITCVEEEELLDLYDSEYCVLPLTTDIPGAVNPFRCDRQKSQLSGLLVHAILALCCHHLGGVAGIRSNAAAEHRRKAVQLLESALKNKPIINLLDPILILFTLECTLSATGTWLAMLIRANRMLQTVGGSKALTTPRMRAQVGMLIWWDATLAFISRQSPIMDKDYLPFLIQWEKQDEWSFFDLTGCPRDLLAHLVQLAELAKQSKVASRMKWLTFNMAPVTQIEHELIRWNNDTDTSLDEEYSYSTEQEAIQKIYEQQDQYHCAEAWRQALLLYIETVFKRDLKPRSIKVHRLVRKTIDNIRCCRQTSLIQKQLLIPVFLAGSEAINEETRDFAKEYCLYWGEKSRYNMFNSVPMLFDEAWASGQWWGAVIDSKTQTNSNNEHERTQFLLG